MSSGGRRGAEKWSSSLCMMRSRCAGLVILYSDELDFSAPRRPQELILGSVGSGQALIEQVVTPVFDEQDLVTVDACAFLKFRPALLKPSWKALLGGVEGVWAVNPDS